MERGGHGLFKSEAGITQEAEGRAWAGLTHSTGP